MSAGYVDCGCRDCFENTIGEPGELCADCVAAGCEADRECRRPDAYTDGTACAVCEGRGCDACGGQGYAN